MGVFFAAFFNQAQPFPWVFVQVPNARIEGRTAPCLERIKAYLVELLHYGQHVLRPHPRRRQRLMGVSQYRLCYLNHTIILAGNVSNIIMIVNASCYF